MAKILYVIAPKNFRDEEYLRPKQVLESAGHKVITASVSSSKCYGMLGAEVKPDILIKNARESVYDAIVIAGGSGSTVLWSNPELLVLVKSFHNANKLVSAICLGTSVLARATIMGGRKMTGWPPDAKDEAEKAKAIYTGENVTIDGNIITAIGPKAVEEFASIIMEKLEVKK